MMEDLSCFVCTFSFNQRERRPKCLPCGHTVCLSCVTSRDRDGKKHVCPFDGKKFDDCPPNDFMDNFYILTCVSGKSPRKPRWWCMDCSKVAVSKCEENHHVCNLRKTMVEREAKKLGTLQESFSFLDSISQRLLSIQEKLRAAMAREAQGVIEDVKRVKAVMEDFYEAVSSRDKPWEAACSAVAREEGRASLLLSEWEEEVAVLGVTGSCRLQVEGQHKSWAASLALPQGALQADSQAALRALLFFLHKEKKLMGVGSAQKVGNINSEGQSKPAVSGVNVVMRALVEQPRRPMLCLSEQLRKIPGPTLVVDLQDGKKRVIDTHLMVNDKGTQKVVTIALGGHPKLH